MALRRSKEAERRPLDLADADEGGGVTEINKTNKSMHRHGNEYCEDAPARRFHAFKKGFSVTTFFRSATIAERVTIGVFWEGEVQCQTSGTQMMNYVESNILSIFLRWLWRRRGKDAFTG